MGRLRVCASNCAVDCSMASSSLFGVSDMRYFVLGVSGMRYLLHKNTDIRYMGSKGMKECPILVQEDHER